MPGKIDVYSFGNGGNNLVKNKLQLSDDELLSSQNGEMVLDQVSGGIGAFTKRGGLAALTTAINSGAPILGILGLNLKTTYTRTLYAAKGTVDSDTWMKSTNGTSWTDTASPLAAADSDKFTDENGTRDARRVAAIRNAIVYPRNSYTKGTNNPPIAVWDGTNALTVGEIPVGPSATAATAAYAITDFLTAAGKVYFAVHDPGGSGANLCGRVMSLDLQSGVIKQIAGAFGNGTGEITGGYPSALCYYQNQLFVGLNGSATTNGIGKVVRCYPDVDTAWTADVSNLVSHVSSMLVFRGDLYVGCQSSTSTAAKLYKRSATAGTYSAMLTSASGAGGSGHYGSLAIYNDEIYAVKYFSGVTDVLHIIKSADGTTWSTSRDVDANDSPTDPPQFPASVAVLGSDLYYLFRATDADNVDGFIMRLSAGSWSKVVTDNFAGPLVVLVERS